MIQMRENATFGDQALDSLVCDTSTYEKREAKGLQDKGRAREFSALHVIISFIHLTIYYVYVISQLHYRYTPIRKV